MSVKCSGYARDSAKVEDQVRFLTWTLMNNMACECDGFARQSSKLLDKVRFLGELLTIDCRVGVHAYPAESWVRIPPAQL
jgi:hypothetical protein